MATLKEQVAQLTALVETLVAAQAAPVATGKPAKAQAKSPAFGDKTFDEYVADRNASRLPCGIKSHGAACNRTFSPKSTGRTNHEARIV